MKVSGKFMSQNIMIEVLKHIYTNSIYNLYIILLYNDLYS